MRPMRMALYWLMLSATLPFLEAQDRHDSGAEAAIRGLEREWVQAQSRNDNRVLDLIFDNDLVYIEYGSLISKGEYLSRIKREIPQTDAIAMELMTIQIFDSTAIVTGSYSETQVHGRRHEVKRWRFIDTWVYKKQHGWALVAAGSSPITN